MAERILKVAVLGLGLGAARISREMEASPQVELVAAELKKDSPLGKACAKAADLLVYDVPKRRVPEWVTKQFAERGVTVDAEAVRLLMEIVGEGPEELASEVDKLATWSAGDAVGVREVQELAAGCAEVPGYDLTDAWGRRDLAAALTACQTLLERSGDPVSRTVPSLIGLLVAPSAPALTWLTSCPAESVPLLVAKLPSPL